MIGLGLLVGWLAAAAPMSYADFKAAVVQPVAPRILSYGADPLQHVELWRPVGAGPFPVVLMLHGGCWRTDVATAAIMHAVAADLMARGIAVWNVEYRGVDRPGGGYPGTFRDVAAAADLLARAGPALGLQTRSVLAVGHSAGGQLAFWLAGRHRIARSSMLWSPHPLPIAAAVSQGGLPDLVAAHTGAAAACGADTVDRLIGAPGRGHPRPDADTSPAALLPLGTPQWLIAGANDTISPPDVSRAYAVRARRAGDTVSVRVIANSGHFELIAPGHAAWKATADLIAALMAQPRPR